MANNQINPPAEDASAYVPEDATLPELRAAAAGCRGCHLFAVGTQTVFGEGESGADLLILGEQPGDHEDRAGRPFVGPAGRLLDAALAEVGIDRRRVYVTNVVKHFKHRVVGKRRIHEKPDAAEILACAPWLDAEIARVGPRVILALGATAAQRLLGRAFRVTRSRGELVPSPHARLGVVATVHPSSILRLPDQESREAARRAFVADLAKVKKLLGAGGAAGAE